MKTILTTITFAFAVMVFAFTATPSYANEETNRKTKNAFTKPAEWIKCNLAGEGRPVGECNQELREHFSELDPETRTQVAAFIGSRFCKIYPDVPGLCQGEWWNSEEGTLRIVSLSEEQHNAMLSSFIDRCKADGDKCLEAEWGEETEIEVAMPLHNTKICKSLPDMYFCSKWFNEDSESKDGEGGRNVADSGDEGSTSAAGANEQ